MNYEVIEQCIKDEIADPKGCYMPNSPAGFVKDRLHKAGYDEEAKALWDHFVWRRPFGIDSIDALMLQLNSLDKKERMPSWGMYGT
jgi:hypothetical protein